MKPIALNRLLTLEDPMRMPDGAGGYLQSWTALGKLWAHVAAQSGREDGDMSTTRYRIYARRMPAGSSARPRPDQRFRDGARVYHIDAVADLQADTRYVICYAHEEVAS
ncbi:MAG: head-tail adaptor protein [Pseudomonadota bacterium]